MIGFNLIFVVRGLVNDGRLNYMRKKNYYVEKTRIKKLISSLKKEKEGEEV